MSLCAKSLPLNGEWSVWQTPAGLLPDPGELSEKALDYFQGQVPGSVYYSLRLANRTLVNGDDFDWWYGIDFAAGDLALSSSSEGLISAELCFERLATIVEVWLNGQLIATHHNFFLPLRIELDQCLRDQNQLRLCFRSVTRFLSEKRPRPRWKTNLVKHQQLRWLRTSLLGRMPSWELQTPATGPCGNVELRVHQRYRIVDANIVTSLSGATGNVKVAIETEGAVEAASVYFGDTEFVLDPQAKGDVQHWHGKAALGGAQLWWPHTHGKAYLYEVTLRILTSGEWETLNLGKRGFRKASLDLDSNPSFLVNDRPVFARGACWTISNPERFWSSEEELRNMLELARQAGMNMIRIGGTMQYEQDSFYRLCDELGILVWQDFMFANMDYPEEESFLRNVTAEVTYQNRRFSAHPCIAVFCGNSEAMQQAAMMGLEREQWSQVLFDELIHGLCRKMNPDVPYVSSSPCGGDLPFHIGEGVAHFYGVGAYQKPVLSSGAERVRFASESLGFSNIPVPKQVEKLFEGASPMCHSPVWKQGVPRDNGAGLDFEDIRDHYFDEVTSQRATELRKTDTNRYLQLSSVIPGELIKQVFAIWRSGTGRCSGGLIWFYRDLVPGAGWGLLDSEGQPKPVYYQLKRAFGSLACFILDLGLDGVSICLINEGNKAVSGTLNLQLIKVPDTVIENIDLPVSVEGGACFNTNLEGALGVFRDATYSYRFGPRAHDLIAASFASDEQLPGIVQDVFFTGRLDLPVQSAADVNITGEWRNDEQLTLTLISDRFLQWVSLELAGASVSDQCFHLVPGVPVQVELSLNQPAEKLKGILYGINLAVPIRFKLKR